MTRIHILSDLHMEMPGGAMPDYVQPECDVVVLAGDINKGTKGIEWAKETFSAPVIFVPGNHDCWERVLSEVLAEQRAAAEGSNVHFLYNDTVVLDGVRFVGSTLWTDYNLFGKGPISALIAHKGIKDFGYRDKKGVIVENNMEAKKGEPILPSMLVTEHLVARQYIADQMSKPFDGKTVVVTHHAPSSESIDPIWENDALTPAYASRLEYFIMEWNPNVWIHGHTHATSDYDIADTRVICNPRGYAEHFPNMNFDPGFVIEV
jgi:predicted phosphodiesterase